MHEKVLPRGSRELLAKLESLRLPELGGSDSHAPYTAGQAWTGFPGQTAVDLRRAIESGSVRAGGPLWTPPSLVRLSRLLIKRRGLRQPGQAVLSPVLTPVSDDNRLIKRRFD